MKGMCFEDNDFVGRLMAQTGAFVGEWTYCVYHQSHIQPAYKVDDPGIARANGRNKDWTRQKWGGIPFDSETPAFDVVREMHKSGNALHRVVDRSGNWLKAKEMASGRIVEAVRARV